MRAELRLGEWADVLGDVEPDVLLTDTPYSERTHTKQRHGRRTNGTTYRRGERKLDSTTRELGYVHWTDADVQAFVAFWSARVKGWFVTFTDSELYPAWRDALRAAGRYVFAPLPAVQVGMNVRLAGDGPSSWTTWIVCARPRKRWKWRTLDGAYYGTPMEPDAANGPRSRRRGFKVMGAKPEWLMRALVRDYSKPGDLICDPCAGSGTTLIAARLEGRHSVGAERDAKAYAVAQARLSRPYAGSLFADELRERRVVVPEQLTIEVTE